MESVRLLLHADVLCDIAEWTDRLPGSQDERRKTLARLARVCQAFHEPAIRVLWRELDTIFHLFLVLPSFVLSRQNAEPSPHSTHQKPYDEYFLPADIPSHEWNRLRKYAVYVKSVTFFNRIYPGPSRIATRWGRMELSRDSWSSIKQLFSDNPVFPNLQHLRWQFVEVDFEVNAFAHFLPSSLRTLAINCQTSSHFPETHWPQSLELWSDRLPMIMEEISTRAPELVKLSLSYGGSLTAAHFLTPLSLTHPASLRDLAIEGLYDSPLQVSDIVLLSRLPLESLTLDGRHRIERRGISNLNPSEPVCAQSVAFSGLRDLRFSRHYDALSSLSLCLNSATVESLHIDEYGFITAPSLRQDCAAWKRAFPSLTDFACTFMPWSRTRVDGLPLTDGSESISAIYTPLLELRNMRRASFRIANVPVIVNDNDLVAFSESWPLLEVLSITTHPYVGDSPGFTVGLSGLLSLARNCPRLAFLDLTSLVIDPVVLSSSMDRTPKQFAMQTLQVRHDLEPAVRRLLADVVFPNLSCKP
ncbi:hypothetical protein PYCCODRAFT_1435362 [Trametes coccinea BRFM310]|uniref:F-box domain-containing protein n=1 Tax=Trametes coccinea (strain BRFM310) TaxID=1353009 RepID=A0A1Y2IQZ4_TRAC3|nr:hypothetical protein PYCCODRAFT_1435362 [Trametes coccinea BRFM310]